MANELAWTRIFSAEFFYTFAFLILSLAILGLGLGALILRMIPALGRDSLLYLILTLCAGVTLAAPPLVFALKLDFSVLFVSLGMMGKMLLVFLLLSSSFLGGGIVLAALFRQKPEDMPRMYMADLLGAGLGVFLAIFLMNRFGTPAAVFLNAGFFILAGIMKSRSWKRIIPIFMLIPMILMMPRSEMILQADRQERAPVTYTHWDALSKVKIYEYDTNYWGLNIDNVANSPVYGFDGNWNRPDSLLFQFGIDVQYLIQQNDSCVFLSLGAGGGVDVLQALQYGAEEIHAVEINGHINEMMKSGMLADFSGHIYSDPRVIVATEDARSYVKRFPKTFDLIYSLSSNTFAALASGAFAMAENYLFTVEAFQDYWNSLSDNGFMMMEHQFYTPRLVAELVEALEAEGIHDCRQHFAVYNLPQLNRKMILLGKQPLTEEIRYSAFFELTAENYEYIHLLYPPADSLKDNLINRIVLNGWESEADGAPIDISPCTDDCPFTAQLGLWRSFSLEKLKQLSPYDFFGFPISKLLTLIIIILVLCIVLPLNLLPMLSKRPGLKPVPWLYFFLIGMGFMMVEVILIQKYALFIGSSLHSILTVLITLLIMSGIGSRFSGIMPERTVFLAISAMLAFEILVVPGIFSWFGHWPLSARIATAAVILAPLGFFMGMPFPKAAVRVGDQIDWGLAVNGAASVLGSCIIILAAFSLGFRMSLFLGWMTYAAAGLLLIKCSGWSQENK